MASRRRLSRAPQLRRNVPGGRLRIRLSTTRGCGQSIPPCLEELGRRGGAVWASCRREFERAASVVEGRGPTRHLGVNVLVSDFDENIAPARSDDEAKVLRVTDRAESVLWGVQTLNVAIDAPHHVVQEAGKRLPSHCYGLGATSKDHGCRVRRSRGLARLPPHHRPDAQRPPRAGDAGARTKRRDGRSTCRTMLRRTAST